MSTIHIQFHRKWTIEWRNNFFRYCTHLKVLRNALEPSSIETLSGIAEKGLLSKNIYVEHQAISYSWEKCFPPAGAKTRSFELLATYNGSRNKETFDIMGLKGIEFV